MEEYPFRCVRTLITYCVECNPARAKSVDLHSQDHKAGRPDADIHWVVAYQAILAGLYGAPLVVKAALFMRHLGKPDERLHISEIAKKLGRSERQIRRWINQSLDDIERAAVARDLIPEPDPSIN